MLKAVCFDLFNTLIDVATVPEQVGKFTADVLDVSHDAWREVCFSDAHEICQPTEHTDVIRSMAHALDASISPETIQQATQERQKRFDYALVEHVDEEVINGLQQLRDAGYALALISNASTAEVQAWPQSPLAGLFDTAVFSCHCGHKKPDAGIYQHTAQNLGLETGQCAFVGDGGSDEFRGASETGMPVLMMTAFTPPARRQQLASKYQNDITATVASVKEVLQWLE